MEIVLIRHGQPAWAVNDRQVVNPALTELGHVQAARMAQRLAHEHFDEVLVSPLQRARQTAAPLYAALDRPETIDEWLREIDDPAWHGQPRGETSAVWEEFEKRPAESRWDGLPGGESIRDFAARVRTGLHSFLADRGVTRTSAALPMWDIVEPGKKIALIAHAGTNTVALGTLLGVEPTPWDWDRFSLGHASITRLVAKPLHDGHAFTLTELSNLEHIAAASRTR